MIRRNVLVGARLGFGVLALVALAVQLGISLRLGFDPVNYFSYFTNLSNLFAAVVLLIAAQRLASGHKPTLADDVIRGASVVGMALVGIVYGLLLRQEELGSLLPWVNVVVHYIMPVVVVADWLYQPPRARLAFRHQLLWLIFPALYLVYSIVRGAATGWYAYPFFNPDRVGGYGGVALYCLGIFVVFLVMGWLLLAAAKRLKRHA